MRRPQTRAGNQLLERPVDPRQPLLLGQRTSLGSSHDDHVVSALELRLHPLEGFPKQALDVVALHRAADLARHRQTESGTVDRSVGKRVEHQMAIGHRATLAIHPLKLGAAREASTAAL